MSGSITLKIKLGRDTMKLIEYYMSREGVRDYSKAVERLVELGYESWVSGKTGSVESIDRILAIEAGYAYYRLRLKEILDEMKSIAMLLSGLASELKVCLNELEKTGLYRSIRDRRIRLEETEERVKRIIEKYVLEARRDLGEKSRVSDKELVESIEKILREYRREFRIEE